MKDYRDHVIETLAAGLAETAAERESLIEFLLHERANADAYRLVAVESLHALARANDERRRVHERHERLQHEYRHLRERVMRDEARTS